MLVPFEGGCRCRAIRYRCSAQPLVALHCYCRDCQYASGGYGATAVAVPADSVTVRGAEPVVHTVTGDSGAPVSRLFCGACGSHLFAKSAANPSVLALKVGSLDDPRWVTPAAHIWTDSAPPWACMDMSLARFPRSLG